MRETKEEGEPLNYSCAWSKSSCACLGYKHWVFHSSQPHKACYRNIAYMHQRNPLTYHIAQGCFMNLRMTRAVFVIAGGGAVDLGPIFLGEHSHQHNPSNRTEHSYDLKNNDDRSCLCSCITSSAICNINFFQSTLCMIIKFIHTSRTLIHYHCVHY